MKEESWGTCIHLEQHLEAGAVLKGWFDWFVSERWGQKHGSAPQRSAWRPFLPDAFQNCCFWFFPPLRFNNFFTPWHARCGVYSRGKKRERWWLMKRQEEKREPILGMIVLTVTEHKELPRLSILLWNAETLHYNKESLLQYFSSQSLLGLGPL